MKQGMGKWAVLTAVTAAVALFVGAAWLQGSAGFPLDDAWIHQTYARSLARDGRFIYAPGVVSSGSTAPLWSILLAVGYLIGVPYKIWAYFLGGASLLGLVYAGMALWRRLWPAQAAREWVAGLVIALSWKLLWGAASGMETVLFAALGLWILVLLLGLAGETAGFPTSKLVGLGICSGLLILTRPDGLALLLLVAAGLLLRERPLRGLAVWGGVTALLLLPYFGFNYAVSGTFWPNTLYAKQAEYAVLLAEPLPGRVLQLLYFSLGGTDVGWRGISSPHLLLLPGILVFLWRWGRGWAWRSWRAPLVRVQLLALWPLLWAGGHVLLYAWRLPVTFQHGRYLLPVQAVWTVYGLVGWGWLLYESRRSGMVVWMVRQVSQVSFILILLFFLVQGAVAYGRDVAVIEGEMVAVARWLAANTPSDQLTAAHDIGAIGYFAPRPILDLAGLISPEVVPYLESEAALADFILRSEAAYLVTAPGWPYTAVAESGRFTEVYTTGFAGTTAVGLNNMTVYQRVDPEQNGK